MEECSVLIETTKSAEDKTSRWFDLSIDYELFRDLLGVEVLHKKLALTSWNSYSEFDKFHQASNRWFYWIFWNRLFRLKSSESVFIFKNGTENGTVEHCL